MNRARIGHSPDVALVRALRVVGWLVVLFVLACGTVTIGVFVNGLIAGR